MFMLGRKILRYTQDDRVCFAQDEMVRFVWGMWFAI